MPVDEVMFPFCPKAVSSELKTACLVQKTVFECDFIIFSLLSESNIRVLIKHANDKFIELLSDSA